MRAVLLLVVASALAAQGPPAFRSDVELVTVPLTVTHRDPNRSVGELAAADFRVLEDGEEQEITLLDHTRRPVSLAIILDTSLSMSESQRAIAHAAIDRTIAGLAPGDEVSVVVFAGFIVTLGWTPVGLVPPIPWTVYTPALRTKLLDAIEVALKQIDSSSEPRPVILIVSDGGENSSAMALGDIVRTRRQSETLTYAYVPGYPENERQEIAKIMPALPSTMPGDQPGWRAPVTRVGNPPDLFLRELVSDSGGTILRAREPESVQDVVQTFLDELNAQYTLGYVPKKVPDGKYRKLKVEARNKDLRVRHRGGYLAMPKS